MVAQKTVDGKTREGSLVKSARHPYAGNQHVRLEEERRWGRRARILRHRLPKGVVTATALLQLNPTGPYSTLRIV
jgi:hypothetical protein